MSSHIRFRKIWAWLWMARDGSGLGRYFSCPPARRTEPLRLWFSGVASIGNTDCCGGPVRGGGGLGPIPGV